MNPDNRNNPADPVPVSFREMVARHARESSSTPEPGSSSAPVPTAKASTAEVRSIAERLAQRFHVAPSDAKTRSFFLRLNKLCDDYGDRAYRCVSEAVAQSVSASKPLHYFCRCVTLKLRESRIFADRTGPAEAPVEW